jgi:FkbM family methyltransferase
LEHGPVQARGTGLGAGVLLDPSSLWLSVSQAHALVTGAAEPSVQEALRRHVASGAVVYDIGASIGFFSLLAARLAGATGRVEAFEPLPAAAAALRRNIELNQASTIHVHEAAVGAQSGRAQLLSVEEASWSHLADRGWHAQTQDVIDVELVCVDDLVAGGMRPPQVVKLDVEGSELAVLDGMTETLRTSSPTLICELHATNAEFVARMHELGYSTQNLDGPEPLPGAGNVHALATRS